ncbi:MAG: DUF6577 family protein [Chloroflexota bacterium]
MALHVPPAVVAFSESSEESARPVLVEDVAAAGLSAAAAEEYLGRLVRQGKLARRGPGVFTVARRGRPELESTLLLKRVAAALRAELPMVAAVGWTTEWLAPYAHNVPTRHWTAVDAAGFALPSIADVLARVRLQAVVDPDPEQVPDLLRLFERPLVLWPHGDMHGAPAGKTPWGLRLPQPERLLVDVYFAATRLGLPYPSNDLAAASARLLAEGDLNVASALAYAQRRGIADEYAAYLRALPRLPRDVAEAVTVVTDRHRNRGSRDARPRRSRRAASPGQPAAPEESRRGRRTKSAHTAKRTGAGAA